MPAQDNIINVWLFVICSESSVLCDSCVYSFAVIYCITCTHCIVYSDQTTIQASHYF